MGKHFPWLCICVLLSGHVLVHAQGPHGQGDADTRSGELKEKNHAVHASSSASSQCSLRNISECKLLDNTRTHIQTHIYTCVCIIESSRLRTRAGMQYAKQVLRSSDRMYTRKPVQRATRCQRPYVRVYISMQICTTHTYTHICTYTYTYAYAYTYPHAHNVFQAAYVTHTLSLPPSLSLTNVYKCTNISLHKYKRVHNIIRTTYTHTCNISACSSRHGWSIHTCIHTYVHTHGKLALLSKYQHTLRSNTHIHTCIHTYVPPWLKLTYIHTYIHTYMYGYIHNLFKLSEIQHVL